LSSSEAEFVAMSEAVKEIRFIYYLLSGMGIDVKIPIIVRSDDVGAIFMAENSSSGVRTRHIDTRYHCSRTCGRWVYQNCFCSNLIKIVLISSQKTMEKKRFMKTCCKFLGKIEDSNQ
jgi:hypothetical protein